MILLLISLYAILLRLVPILNNKFTFMYDHAKDSLVLREMFLYHKPALIGPTTSIPGVFYGPLWYYLALPLNILGKFHPFASVLTVLIMTGVCVYLAGKYLGRFEALLFAVSGGLIGSQQSAWTPYMTSFFVLPALIILKKIQKSSKISYLDYILLFLTTSLLFHFQPAFAVVFTPLVIIILYTMKKLPVKKIGLVSLSAFLIPFLPSLIFELRHHFHQTKIIIGFIQNFQSQRFIIQPNKPNLILRMLEIAHLMADSAASLLPSLKIPSLKLIIIILLAIYLLNKKGHKDRPILLPLIFGTFVFYLILPCKPYYLIALLPVWIYSFSQAVKKLIPKTIPFLVLFIILLSLVNLVKDINRYNHHAQTDPFILSPKMKAVQLAYILSENQPFVSYHFVPDVYDYTYQHIYLYFSKFGKKLPLEFSYAPGESSYIPQKHISAKNNDKPKYVILIVEPYKPYTAKEVYYEWWDRVAKNIQILEKHQVNQAIIVYKGVYR